MTAIVSLQNGFVNWHTIDWQQANKIVSNLRGRIFRAAAAGDLRKVRQLRKLLLRSTANVVLAVRRVTQVNRGRNTAGIDKVIVKTAAERGTLSSELMDLT
jgi:RNA-directed DNA polymerase